MSVEMQPSDITHADRQEIEQSVKRWIQLSLDRDFEKLIDELCTSDVTLLPPDHPVCVGAAESLGYLNEYPEIESFDASVETVHGRGETAIVRGTFDMTVKQDGSSINAIGKWLGAYRKTTNGWKVTHDIWNNDAPMG